VQITNVPRNSVVTLEFNVFETDGGINRTDWGDLNPGDGDGTMVLTLWPAELHGRTQQAGLAARDLTFGQRKRVVGDGGGGRFSDFRAAVEFTVRMVIPPGVAGAVGGPPAPQVGGAIGGRDTGLTGPGQALPSREDRCRDYAISAVQQNTQQLAHHCGYGPPVWNGDPDAHFAWCMQANNVDLTQAGWLMREAGLATCLQTNP